MRVKKQRRSGVNLHVRVQLPGSGLQVTWVQKTDEEKRNLRERRHSLNPWPLFSEEHVTRFAAAPPLLNEERAEQHPFDKASKKAIEAPFLRVSGGIFIAFLFSAPL